MSDVYFVDMKMSSQDNMASKIRKLFLKAGYHEKIADKDFVAIKTHFGEYGNLAFLPPPLLKVFVSLASECGGKPFVTDTNTLYRGHRSNAIDHLENAELNGFNRFSLGAPVIIADGIRGNDFVEVPASGKHYSSIRVASAIQEADAMMVVSHVKGHELYGFGGAIKNVAMGCAPPSGKQSLHSEVKPKVKQAKCESCGMCIKRCPVDAIAFNDEKKAFIDSNICIGCGECTVICPYGAIPVRWKTDKGALQERTIEYVKGVCDQKKDKIMYFNFIMNVTPECDCVYWNDMPIVADIGILASMDPVAIDRASVDLVNNSRPLEGSRIADKDPAVDHIRAMFPIDWEYMFEYGEKMGLGKNSYNMISL